MYSSIVCLCLFFVCYLTLVLSGFEGAGGGFLRWNQLLAQYARYVEEHKCPFTNLLVKYLPLQSVTQIFSLNYTQRDEKFTTKEHLFY